MSAQTSRQAGNWCIRLLPLTFSGPRPYCRHDRLVYLLSRRRGVDDTVEPRTYLSPERPALLGGRRFPPNAGRRRFGPSLSETPFAAALPPAMRRGRIAADSNRSGVSA